MIAIGTTGFMVLPGLYSGEPLNFINALFTATSAVCVTGLIVVDPEIFFTPMGQAWILLLIQLGGLGIITFTSLIIAAFGQRLSRRQQVLTSRGSEVVPKIDPLSLTRDVVLFTLSFEVLGAVLLYFAFLGLFDWIGVIWPAIFHSISAFCNAGFSTFSTSLVAFNQNPWVLSVVMGLIVLGRIGFRTLEELYLFRRSRATEQRFRLSLHSKLVLIATVLLLVGGWVGYAILEWKNTLHDMSIGGTLLNSLFASVTARTAGFNTFDYGEALPGTNFGTMILMSIGDSPGSTAGGIKTTTFMLLGLLAWCRLRGYDFNTFQGRTIPESTTEWTTGLFVIAFGLMTAGIFIFSTIEIPGDLTAKTGFLHYMFETVSAFNTVGLSMGVTTDLSFLGRVATICLMFIGRVGPLTVAVALSTPRHRRKGPTR